MWIVNSDNVIMTPYFDLLSGKKAIQALSPSINKFANEFIYSGLSAE